MTSFPERARPPYSRPPTCSGRPACGPVWRESGERRGRFVRSTGGRGPASTGLASAAAAPLPHPRRTLTIRRASRSTLKPRKSSTADSARLARCSRVWLCRARQRLERSIGCVRSLPTSCPRNPHPRWRRPSECFKVSLTFATPASTSMPLVRPPRRYQASVYPSPLSITRPRGMSSRPTSPTHWIRSEPRFTLRSAARLGDLEAERRDGPSSDAASVTRHAPDELRVAVARLLLLHVRLIVVPAARLYLILGTASPRFVPVPSSFCRFPDGLGR